ncbi:peptidylprolyl isomerase [Microbulbifer sp. SAOS-129_SWC]|uniref:peptidylprolyl isomerase n=1 Tax=Microbulbifer sp. SAOS-129_SWC TaxID=3145235 RepID=UPI003217D042
MRRLYALLLTCLLAVPALAENPQVDLKTDLGTIRVELYADKAPATVKNFLAYVDSGFYNGVIFHRVIPGFVVQAGGFTFDFQEKDTRKPVVNESTNGLQNLRGTLAMARTSDPDSATSQFYINLKHNDNLDARGDTPGYTVFGKVTSGMDVVDKIVAEPRGLYRAHPEAPNYPVRILDAHRVGGNAKTEGKQS